MVVLVVSPRLITVFIRTRAFVQFSSVLSVLSLVVLVVCCGVRLPPLSKMCVLMKRTTALSSVLRRSTQMRIVEYSLVRSVRSTD